MIYEYGVHITGWWRTKTFLAERIEGLKYALDGRDPNQKGKKEVKSERGIERIIKIKNA